MNRELDIQRFASNEEAIKQQMFIKFNEGFSADSENKVFTSNVSGGIANITLGSDALIDVENVYLFYTFYCTEMSKDSVSINIYDSSIEGTDGELVNESISMSSNQFYKMGKIYIGTLTGDTNIDVTFYKTNPMGGSGWFKFYLGQGTGFDTVEAAGFRGYEKGAYKEGDLCLADGVVVTYDLNGSFTTTSLGWTRKEDIVHGAGTPVTYFTKRFTSNSNETLDILYNGETVQLPVSIYEMNSNINVLEGADQIYYGTAFINVYTFDSVEWKYHANEGYKIENVPTITNQDLQSYGYDSSYEFKGWNTSFATDNMTIEDIATVVLFPEYMPNLDLSMSAWIEKKTATSNVAVNGIRLNGQRPSSVYIGNQEIIKIIYNNKVIYNKGEGLLGHTYADLATMTHEQLAQYTHAELAGGEIEDTIKDYSTISIKARQKTSSENRYYLAPDLNSLPALVIDNNDGRGNQYYEFNAGTEDNWTLLNPKIVIDNNTKIGLRISFTNPPATVIRFSSDLYDNSNPNLGIFHIEKRDVYTYIESGEILWYPEQSTSFIGKEEFFKNATEIQLSCAVLDTESDYN